MISRLRDKNRLLNLLDVVLLVCVTFAAYVRVFSSGFIESYDDEMYITLNPVVSQGFSWESLAWSFTSFVSGNWHPITWWSHLIDVSLFGLQPMGHHGVSLGIHIINSLLLYFFLLRATGVRGCSLVAAALFGVHPLHVESVAWVAERKDVLSTLFILGALHAYLSFVVTERLRFYLLLFVLLCCSLMAKPMMVTLPFLLLLLDYWPLERYRTYRWSTLVKEKLPLLVPVAIISTVTIAAQQWAGALKTLAGDSVAIRLGNGVYAYVIYLKKFFLPYDLASFYPYSAVDSARVLAAFILLSAVFLFVWRNYSKKPWLVFGWVWFLVALVPVVGILRVGEQAYADRYMYVPMIGLIVIMVWSCVDIFQRFRFSLVLNVVTAICLVTVYATATAVQTGYWRDSYTLYSRELAVIKDNWHGHFGLANALAKQKEYEEAIRHYQAALVSRPNLIDAHNNLGSALRSLGRHQEAIPCFLKAMELNPNYLSAYFNLALTLTDIGDRREAAQLLQRVLAIEPSFREAKELLTYLSKPK